VLERQPQEVARVLEDPRGASGDQLGADDGLVVEADDRSLQHAQAVAGQEATNPLLRIARARFGAPIRGRDAVLAAVLAVAQRRLRPQEHFVERRDVVVQKFDAETQRDVERVGRDAQRPLRDRESQPLGDLQRFGEARVRQEHEELVSADPSDVIGGSQRLPEVRRELLERRITAGEPEVFVDLLEIVAVDQQGRERSVGSALPPKLDRELRGESAAIQELGQRIDARELLEARVQAAHPRGQCLELRVRALVIGDVEERHQPHRFLLPPPLDALDLEHAIAADRELLPRTRIEREAQAFAAEPADRRAHELFRRTIGEQHRARTRHDHEPFGALHHQRAKAGFALLQRAQPLLHRDPRDLSVQRAPDAALEQRSIGPPLHQEVLGASVRTAVDRVLVLGVGHDDDRHVGRRRAQPTDRIDAGRVRQIGIEQHDVESAGARSRNRLAQRAAMLDSERSLAGHGELGSYRADVVDVVLDQQCANRFHAPLAMKEVRAHAGEHRRGRWRNPAERGPRSSRYANRERARIDDNRYPPTSASVLGFGRGDSTTRSARSRALRTAQ
jgi:hypothetical protein